MKMIMAIDVEFAPFKKVETLFGQKPAYKQELRPLFRFGGR